MSERNKEIVALYKQGELTLRELGERYGISESRICQIIKQEGYSGQAKLAAHKEARERLKAKRKAQKVEARLKREAIITEMWLANETTYAIGEVIGIHPSIVGRTAKRLGLQQRRRGGWDSSRHITYNRSMFTPEEIAERKREQQAIAETEPEAYEQPKPKRARRRTWSRDEDQNCICGERAEVRCICERMRCEDHIYMTRKGMRCEVCVAA